MLIKIPKGWETPEREATPEGVYREPACGGAGRRRFLKQVATASIVGAGAVAGLNLGMKALAPDAPFDAKKYAALKAARNPKFAAVERPVTAEAIVARYNNFYEFTTDKEKVWTLADRLTVRPWEIEINGLVEKPSKIDVDALIRQMPLEERVYRLRCVEAWSVVVPWTGFPLAKFVAWAKPLAKARFVRMVSFLRPEQAIGQATQTWYPWPYFEGLTMEEATNELTLLVVGSYGHLLPTQNGAPIRLITPWKYGFKSIKSIVRFEFLDKRPANFWNVVAPAEYDFFANVNPKVPHPRWSQATETDVATGRRIPTQPFNGYADFVAHLYK